MTATSDPTAALPPGNEGVGTAAPRAPLCFIFDADQRIRHFLSLILHGAGVDADEFHDFTDFRKKRPPRPADLIFLNIGPNSNDAVAVLEALGKARYSGVVQLMSAEGLVTLEHVKRIGEGHGLRILPVLKKPFEVTAIKKILQAHKLGDQPSVAARIRLEDALKSGWIETWYQPKINLRKKQLSGVEAFARVRHPDYGVLPPSAFMPGSDDSTLLTLAEQTLVKVMKSGLTFSQLGVNLRIAINMSLDSLIRLPVRDIVKNFRPDAKAWAGLIIDITEEQVVTNVDRVADMAKQLQEHNVKLAIDDFGRAVSSLVKIKGIPFAEMKLDRLFVTDCSADKVNASICKTVIDTAHSFDGVAVGIGLEKASDVTALIGMGCDLGQGFLLGQPMAEERFVALLKQRAASQAVQAPAPAHKKYR
ncbi:MAG TPA: EAL domain-containing response regulator [Xanthobacteraceae bacterium]|nr:EAL domain-containing response regulator [Xanthobacteraceae bacterium]